MEKSSLVYNETSIYMNSQLEDKYGKFACINVNEQLSDDLIICEYE